MKKGDVITVLLDNLSKLNQVSAKPIETESNDSLTSEPKIRIKNGVPGQKAKVRISKKRHGVYDAQLLEYLDLNKPEDLCENYLICGGCTFNVVESEKERKIKEDYLKDLFSGYPFEGLLEVPDTRSYRNKMEYSFGNKEKDGEMTLGLHERGRFYNILNTNNCVLAPEDFEIIRTTVLDYFKDKNKDFYHKNTNEGFLRFLVLRKGIKSDKLLINLVTTTQDELDKEEFIQLLKNSRVGDKISGILWTTDDNVADAVIPEKTEVLYGTATLNDTICGIDFTITPYSFFQVNTKGADTLFSIVRYYAKLALSEKDNNVIYDLYSGVGTAGLILADLADRIYGIEIVDEAVQIAKENAKKNNIENIEFISGDVLKEAEKLTDRPDLIILDPPRSGINPIALKKILSFEPNYFIYISCNPVPLSQDLKEFEEAGYKVEKMTSVNMFPMTTNVETVALLKKINV